jgi:hypothetical protein
MAYNSGNIVSADPAAALITAIEGVLDSHTGNWEFVETTTSTIPYNVWVNRGSGVDNPNAWGTSFHLAIGKVSTTAVHLKVFESWDATNKKMIRPVIALSTKAVNANGSYGDETNGYSLNDTTNSARSGWSGLATTGFDWFVAASKDRLCIALKQGTGDDFISLGVFETLLTSSPVETFPLYLTSARPTSSPSSDTSGFTSATSTHYALSRHPGISATLAENFKGDGQNVALAPLLGGIDTPTVVDRLHNNSWIYQRPTVQMYGGNGQGQPATYGRFRGLIYDVALLNNNGSSMRNGDTVTFGGDTYVKMFNATAAWFVKRDAV